MTHLRVRHIIADYTKAKFQFFAHSHDGNRNVPKGIKSLRKSANKNTIDKIIKPLKS